jgi:hypothetical protein
MKPGLTLIPEKGDWMKNKKMVSFFLDSLFVFFVFLALISLFALVSKDFQRALVEGFQHTGF